MLVPVAPGTIFKAVGEAEMVNDGGRAMVSAMEVLLVSAPDVPVIVTVAAAAAAVPAAVKVTKLVRLGVIGPKVAVTPAGSPDAASATVALKPDCGVTAMVLVPFAPGARVTLAGVAESVKLGVAGTVIAIEVLLLTAAELPVMVMVEVPGAALAAA